MPMIVIIARRQFATSECNLSFAALHSGRGGPARWPRASGQGSHCRSCPVAGDVLVVGEELNAAKEHNDLAPAKRRDGWRKGRGRLDVMLLLLQACIIVLPICARCRIGRATSLTGQALLTRLPASIFPAFVALAGAAYGSRYVVTGAPFAGHWHVVPELLGTGHCRSSRSLLSDFCASKPFASLLVPIACLCRASGRGFSSHGASPFAEGRRSP